MQGVQFGYAVPMFLNGKQAGKKASQDATIHFSSQGEDRVQFGNSGRYRELPLRKGGTASGIAIAAITAKLEDLRLRDEVDVLLALVDKCRADDYNAVVIENNRDRRMLTRLGFINEDGTMDPTIRNIVVSATEGEGIALRLVDPIQRPAAQSES